MDRYSALDFEIRMGGEDNSWDELASRKGKLTKDLCMYWQCVPWRDGTYKDMLYRKDSLKDTLQVVEETIFHPEDYDEANHMWVTKDREKI